MVIFSQCSTQVWCYQQLNKELPVNIKFCFEAMEESGSIGLGELINERKGTFFSDVDYVTISDNYWLGKNTPCITYGLRGNVYFFVEITCANQCRSLYFLGCVGDRICLGLE